MCRKPDPAKQGTRIQRWRYELVRDAILHALDSRPEGFPFRDLPSFVGTGTDAARKVALQGGQGQWEAGTIPHTAARMAA